MADIQHKRLREVREHLGLTQAEMGEQLGLSGSTADMERGKTRITGRVVMQLMRDHAINPLWLYGQGAEMQVAVKAPQTMPRTLVLDRDGEENILMVPAQAAAGYGQNVWEPGFESQLKSFRLPLDEFRNGSFRAFQIRGDSMIPMVESGDWVLASAVDGWEDVQDDKVYVIVERESIRLKKVGKNKDGLVLISLNPEYAPTEVAGEDILELWEYRSRLSSAPLRDRSYRLQDIYLELKKLQNKID